MLLSSLYKFICSLILYDHIHWFWSCMYVCTRTGKRARTLVFFFSSFFRWSDFRFHNVVIKFKCRNGNEKIHFRLKIDDCMNNVISPLPYLLLLDARALIDALARARYNQTYIVNVLYVFAPERARATFVRLMYYVEKRRNEVSKKETINIKIASWSIKWSSTKKQKNDRNQNWY